MILGTNCGGSDGNSGVTANPALGVASDLLVAQGGTSILGETPEIYGAEHLLTRRAVSRAVGEKLVERIKWWEWYTGIFGAEINNNPSPGNKEGGLTTIYEKSLGAIAKGGSTALVDVVRYAEPVKAKGFVVMDTPGYDPVSMTGIVAGGANVLVFTTGRGSVFGCKPAPSIKVATNTPMYEHMIDDMDVNAGGDPDRHAGGGSGPADFRGDSGGGERQEDQERVERRRRGGVRPVEHRADVVKKEWLRAFHPIRVFVASGGCKPPDSARIRGFTAPARRQSAVKFGRETPFTHGSQGEPLGYSSAARHGGDELPGPPRGATANGFSPCQVSSRPILSPDSTQVRCWRASFV